MIVRLSFDATVDASVYISDSEAEDLAPEEIVDKACNELSSYYFGDDFVRLGNMNYSRIDQDEDHPNWDYDVEVQGGVGE